MSVDPDLWQKVEEERGQRSWDRYNRIKSAAELHSSFVIAELGLSQRFRLLEEDRGLFVGSSLLSLHMWPSLK